MRNLKKLKYLLFTLIFMIPFLAFGQKSTTIEANAIDMPMNYLNQTVTSKYSLNGNAILTPSFELPANAVFSVEEVTDKETLEKYEERLKSGMGMGVLYNVSLIVDGSQYGAVDGTFTISFKIPENLKKRDLSLIYFNNRMTLKVAVEDDKVEEMINAGSEYIDYTTSNVNFMFAIVYNSGIVKITIFIVALAVILGVAIVIKIISVKKDKRDVKDRAERLK